METLFEQYNDVAPILKISSLISQQKQEKKNKRSGITNERQVIVKEFVDEINKERTGTKYKQVDSQFIAVKLGILKTNRELYEFLSECRDYKNRYGSFSKRFFGGFKEKKLSTR